MSARTLQLPRLVAGRDYADDLVDSLGLEPGADVVVDAGELLSGTPSFAAELVRRGVGGRPARSVVVLHSPAHLLRHHPSAPRGPGGGGEPGGRPAPPPTPGEPGRPHH